MKKLFKFFMFLTIPLLSVLVVSCGDDDDPEEPLLVPTITAVNPTEGWPGTIVTISGTNLRDVNQVQFGGIDAEDFNPDANTATAIAVTVPEGVAVGATQITVTGPGGTDSFDFTVIEEDVQFPAPVITALEPTMGRSGDAVTIFGSDLAGVTSITFGETEVEDFTIDEDESSITTTVPEGLEEGVVTVTIASEGGEATADFTILGVAPVIATFDPLTGAVGDEITVTGTDLNLATSARIGDVAIEDWTALEDGTSATFTVPEGAQTGRIILVTESGEEIESETDFTVAGGENVTIVEHTDVVVNAQGVRNDEGMVTAFSAEGETFTLAEGTDEATSAMIDFIAADSGGDNGLDLFSPEGSDWLTGNYFEDADDQPVVWPVRNLTKMVHLEDQGADFFENVTAAELAALTIGEEFETRIEISPNEDGSPNVPQVILFETAEGQKGLLLYKAHDPNAEEGSKADIFTFDIKVLEME